MKFVAITAAALVLTAGLARAESEQPHPGFVSPTYHGGSVEHLSGEAGGDFDLSRARPLWGGGHTAANAEEGGSFNAAEAVRIGTPDDPTVAVAGRADDLVR
jgi:hypothetical protein